MLVYGERRREVDSHELINKIKEHIFATVKLPTARSTPIPPLADMLAIHTHLVDALLLAGELEQGVADAEDEEYAQQGQSMIHHFSTSSIIARRLFKCCRALGLLNERGKHRLAPEVNRIYLDLRSLKWPGGMPKQILVKPIEGYAYYGLYPEMYIRATQQFLNESDERGYTVIGILSAGASLGATVAGTLWMHGKQQLFYNVRPLGHPFRRELHLPPTNIEYRKDGVYLNGNAIHEISDTVAKALILNHKLSDIRKSIKQQRFHLIVDEGPGLSGSSFGAVADWLEGQGLARERIVFFPAHDNPLGPQASEAHRERWATARKYVTSFEQVFIETGRLAKWVSDLTGGVGELEDIGYGRWRAKLLPTDEWPPVNLWQERRKYLCNAGGRTRLLKFIGLGHYGEDKLPLAKSLAQAGFTPRIVGLRHGFLVSEWLAEAQPLTNKRLHEIDRAPLIKFIARYLAHRARHFAAPLDSGATVGQLFEMMRYNTQQSIGEDYAAQLDKWQAQLGDMAAAERRVLTDNKIQPWEWLLLPDGRFLKADAIDHHNAHDLIGAQDIAWDIVGAILEFGLSRDEADTLLAAFAAHAGYRPTQQQLAFYTHAYIAFQVGHYTLSASAMGGEEDEAARLKNVANRWADKMRETINRPFLT